MTNQNNQEMLELLENIGACKSNNGVFFQLSKDEAIAFASALREKDAKLIAGLVDALNKYGWHDKNCVAITESGCPPCDCGFEEAVSAAQPTVESFMAEHDARALAELADRWEVSSDPSKAFAVELLRALAAEKRTQAKQEGEGK